MKIEFQGQPITGNSESTLVKAWARSESKVKFADRPDKDIDFATDCIAFSHQYLKSLPIGCNVGDKEALHKKITQAIKEEVVPKHYSSWKRAGIVVLAILFFPITIEIIIAWAIWKALDVAYDN